MADTMFISGKPASFQLKASTLTPGTISIPCHAGGYTQGDNDVIVNMAQGSTVAAGLNVITGIYTPAFAVTCHPYPVATTAGWWSAVNLKALMGPVTGNELTARTDSNGDLTNTFLAKLYNGKDTAISNVKLASIRITGDSSSNTVVVQMGFLGYGDPSALTMADAFVQGAGSPIYWKSVSAATWATVTAGVAGTPASIAPTLHAFDLAIGLGASQAKIADATDYPSRVDPSTTLTWSLVLDQRAGSDKRVMTDRFGQFSVTIGGVVITCSVNRQGIGYPVNVNGQIIDRTAWQGLYNGGVGITIA